MPENEYTSISERVIDISGKKRRIKFSTFHSSAMKMTPDRKDRMIAEGEWEWTDCFRQDILCRDNQHRPVSEESFFRHFFIRRLQKAEAAGR